MREADTSATTSANKALVRRWFEEVWNQGCEESIDELFAAHGVAYGLGDTETPIRGPAGIKPFVRNLRDGLPDIHMVIEDIMAEGDKVIVRVSVMGTHKGDSLGAAPTGRRVHFEGMVVVRMANGQIVEGWNSWDQLGLLRQIGALPALQGPDSFTTARA